MKDEQIFSEQIIVCHFGVLSFLFLNIQGITNKIEILEEFNINCKCDFVCLSVHWVSITDKDSSNLLGYNLAAFYATLKHIYDQTLIVVAAHHMDCQEMH